jgi:hypothetical protein
VLYNHDIFHSEKISNAAQLERYCDTYVKSINV